MPLNCAIRPFPSCKPGGAAVTNEVAVGVCLLLHGAHKTMHMYGRPWGAAAPAAPTDAGPVVV